MEKVAVVYRFPEGETIDSVTKMLTNHSFYNSPGSASIYDEEGQLNRSGFLEARYFGREGKGSRIFVEARVHTRLEGFLRSHRPS